MTEFRKSNNGAPYRTANKYGWIDEYDWLIETKKDKIKIIKKTKNKVTIKHGNKKEEETYTKEECEEICKIYINKSNLLKNNYKIWKICKKNGWLNEFYPNSQRLCKWKEESVYDAAKQCSTPSEMQDKYPGAFSYAIRHNLLKTYDWLYLPKVKKWNKETCYQEAKKYKSRSEFNNNCGAGYDTARKNGWLSEYTWFDTKWKKKWDKASCYEEAKKYTYKIDFMTQSSGAYEAAQKNEWVEEYNWLKSANGVNQHKNSKKPIIQLTKDNKYVATFECCSKCPKEYDFRFITQCCTHEGKTAYGYKWMYEEVYKLIQDGLSWKEAMNKFSPKKKEVVQFDLAWNYIKEWPSVSEACENVYGHFSKRLAFCCSHSGKSFAGYFWKWKIDCTYEDYMRVTNEDDKEYIEKMRRNICNIFEPVVQFSLSDDYIRTYNTRAELQNELKRKGIRPVLNACKGIANTAFGFKWKFLKNYRTDIEHKEIKMHIGL